MSFLAQAGIGILWAATTGGVSGHPVRNSMMAESPFTTYTASAVVYVLVVAFLVAVLLIGGLLVLNLGLMSKRPEDHIGGRTPSDVGILKHSVWPFETERRVFPAEEGEDEELPFVAESRTPTHPLGQEERGPKRAA